jgi:hypothetical protein
VGKSKEKEVDQRTALEKMQDLSRDIFVSLFILVVLVIPTTYIGVRSFQPMTIPGYTGTTFANYLIDQFSNHVDMDLQTEAFLEVVVSPYASAIDVVTQLFPQLEKRNESPITLKSAPDSWWNAIQGHCIFWLERAGNYGD